MSQNLFQTLLKRATYALTGTLVGRIAAALAGILMARSLQTEMFGIYSTLWELTLLCGNITETGMNIGIQRDGAKDRDNLGQLLGNALLVRIAIGVPALIIAYFYSFKMTHGYSSGMIYLFLSIASTAVFLSEPMYSVLQVLGRQKYIAFIESLRGLLTLAAISILVALKRGVVEMAFLQGILYCFTFALLARTTLKLAGLEIEFKTIIPQFTGSFVYGISGLLFSMYSRMPILLLSYFKGPAIVGYYAAAYRVISILYYIAGGVYLRAFLSSLFHCWQKGFKEFQNAGNFTQQWSFVTGVILSLSTYVAADSIILILMGNKYYESIAIMRILSISVFLGYMLCPFDAVMIVADKNYLKIIFQAIGTVAGAGLGYYLITRFGGKGAAFTDNVIRFIQLCLFSAFVYKAKYLTFDSLVKFLIPLALVAVCGVLLVVFMPAAFVVRPILFFFCGITIIVASTGPEKLFNLIFENKFRVMERLLRK